MEVANVRTQFQQQIGCRAGVIVRFGAVRIFTQVVQHGRENLFWRIQEGDAAAFQFFEVFRFQHQIPTVDRHIAQYRFDFINVIANAGGGPQVRHRVFVVRVMLSNHFQHIRVHVLPVRQLALIERLEHTGG